MARNPEVDYHHFNYTRAQYCSTKLGKLIRDHVLSGMIMLKPIHVDLHRNVEPSKPPESLLMREKVYGMLQNAKGSYEPLDAAKMMSEAGIPELSDNIRRQIPFLELSVNAMKRRTL